MNANAEGPSLATGAPSSALGFLARLLRAAPVRGRIRTLMACARKLGGPLIAAPVGALRLLLDPRDYEQARMALGIYEPETTALLERILRTGDVYIDAGAQLGYFAALAAQAIGPSGSMLLLEPDPRPYNFLRAAIASARPNRLPATRLLPVAASDRTGSSTLSLSKTLGRSSLSPATTTDLLDACSVVAQTLDALIDEWLPDRSRKIRLLKIDVEGHEPWLLRGLAEALSRKRIEFIIIEKNPTYLAAQGHVYPALDAFLRSFGYSGAHEDGKRTTRQTLDDGKLENMIYAADAGEWNGILPGLARTAIDDDFSPEEIERLAAETARADHPAVLARRIVLKARSEALDEAIAEASGLIESHPELHELRGHLAYWKTISPARKNEVHEPPSRQGRQGRQE